MNKRWISMVVASLVLATTAHASGRDSKHLFRFGVSLLAGTGEGDSSFQIDPLDPDNGTFRSGTTNISTDVTPALWVGYEYKPSARLGVGVNLEYSSLTLEFDEFRSVEKVAGGVVDGTGEGSLLVDGSLKMLSASIDLNIYLKSTERWHFFVAPVVGYAIFDNMESEDWNLLLQLEPSGEFFPFTDQFNSDVDNTLIYGARLGFDFELSEDTMVLHTGVGYVKMQADAVDEGVTLNVDPIVLRLGLAARF